MRAIISTSAPSKKRYLACAVSLAIGGICIPMVNAQDSSSFQLEEVVVTARKRAESLQDVPAAVNAFSEQAIEDAGIEEMSDYVGLVSNVSLTETQNSAFTFVNIRGNPQMRNSEPSVAIAVDGVLSTSPLSFSQEMFDVQQIEVLKGPQGALYGRNAVGGAINITTRQPTNETEGMVRAGYGNGNTWKTQAGISGAIIEDELLYRVAGSYKDSDGIRKNSFNGREIDPYHAEAIQAKLIWTPSDTFAADFRLSFSDNTGNGAQFVSNAPVAQTGFTGFVPPFLPSLPVGQPGFTVDGGSIIQPVGLPSEFPNNQIGDPNNVTSEVQSNIAGKDDRETYNASVKLDWQTDFGTITATSSYDLVDHYTGGDQWPYTSAAVQKFSQYRNSESFSQEFKITSPADQALRWIAGVYYVQTEFTVAYNTRTDTTGINVSSGADSPVGVLPGTTTVIGDDPTIAFSNDFQDNVAYAAFTQFNYDFTDELEVSFALRYDNDEREITTKTPAEWITFSGSTSGAKRSETYDAVQPKLTVRYEPSDEWTVYASYAEGFRSGGFNASGIQGRAEFLNSIGVINLQGVLDDYEQEDSAAVELGFKSTLMDGRLKLSGAVYSTDVDNQPTFTFVAALNNAQILRAIDEVTMEGFELEAVFAVNENLRLWGSYGYTDTEITKFDAEVASEGNKVPFSPEETINLGIQYHHTFTLGGREMEAMFRADWNRIGETWFESANFAPRDEVDLLNLRVGLDITEDLNLVFWGKNVTNEDYITEAVNPAGAIYFTSLATYGMEITQRF